MQEPEAVSILNCLSAIWPLPAFASRSASRLSPPRSLLSAAFVSLLYRISAVFSTIINLYCTVDINRRPCCRRRSTKRRGKDLSSETVKEPCSLTVEGILALHRGRHCLPWSARGLAFCESQGVFSGAELRKKQILFFRRFRAANSARLF